MVSNARRVLIGKPARMPEIIAHARRLAYLGTVPKVLDALRYEYGTDRLLPSAKTIQSMIDERNKPMRSIHVEARRP